jgi:hypothetical protein
VNFGALDILHLSIGLYFTISISALMQIADLRAQNELKAPPSHEIKGIEHFLLIHDTFIRGSQQLIHQMYLGSTHFITKLVDNHIFYSISTLDLKSLA